jgi:hypothetical protein
MEGIKITPWNEKNVNKIKTIEEIDTAINEISSLINVDVLSYEYLHEFFFKNFDGCPITDFSIEKDFFKSLKIYRVRPNSKEIYNEIHIPDTFSCPPWNKECRTGRANWNGKNVFYGSDNPLTALKEAKQQNTEREYYVAKWGFDFNKFKTDQIRISTFVFDIPEENPWSNFINDYKNRFLESLNKNIGKDETLKLFHLINRLSQLFIDLDESKYRITAYLADQRIYYKHNTEQGIYFPILIYPSVADEKKNCNFAIHPFFVKEYMKLETVFHIKLDANSLKYDIEKIGFNSDENNIEWYTPFCDISNSIYKITSLYCCSINNKIDLNYIESITFSKNDKIITHGAIVADFLYSIKSSDYYNLDDILTSDGIATRIELSFSAIHLENITASINGVEYTDLFIDLNIKQPFEYKSVSK